MTNESLQDQILNYHESSFTDYLPIEALVDGGLYIICARNAYVGVWRECEEGFEIARLKVGTWYLFIEFHYDVKKLIVDEEYLLGTAKPLKLIGSLFNPQKEGLLEFLIQLEIDNPIVPGIDTITKKVESDRRFLDHLSGKNKKNKLPVYKILIEEEKNK